MALRTKKWGQRKPPVNYGLDWGDPINSGLVSVWLMNEAAGSSLNDIGKGRLTGIFSGATWGVGRRGPAVNFVAASSQSIVNPSLVTTTWPCTLSVWFKQASTHTGVMLALDNNGIGADVSRSQIYVNTNALWGTTVPSSGTNADITSATTLVSGRWYHGVHVRYSATLSELFLDGVLQGTSTIDVTLSTAPKAVRFGARHNGTSVGGYFDGSLDGVRVFNRALTRTEVLRLYTEPFAGILAPRRRIIRGAAAAGFLPAWASGSSQILSGGYAS